MIARLVSSVTSVGSNPAEAFHPQTGMMQTFFEMTYPRGSVKGAKLVQPHYPKFWGPGSIPGGGLSLIEKEKGLV